MAFGVRGKLFFASLALITVAGLASAVFLERQLRSWLEHRIESEMLRQARTAREVLRAVPPSRTSSEYEELARGLGRSTGDRVTIILEDGTVVGDSELDEREVRALENLAEREEVRAALATGQGLARRRDAAARPEMLFAAVSFRRPDGWGVVRVGAPLHEVDAAVRRLRMLVLLAGVLGLAVAVAISALASQIVSWKLRDLMRSARELARGEKRRIPVPSSDEFGRLAGSINEISTELERTVAVLAGERDRFETVLESMSEAVLAVDRDGRVELANPAAREILRLDASPVGRLLLEVLRVPALNELLVRGERARPATIEFELPSGPPRRILARVSPLRASAGHVVVLHDVTELRQLEIVRRDFVANVSHELRTPVSVVLANAETLLDGALDDRASAETFLRAIHANAGRLARLISDLLDLSRIEAGRWSLDLREVPVEAAIDRAVEVVRPVARDRLQSIRIRSAEGLRVRADSKALDQVLTNLLDNAVKYTPEGGHITVGAVASGHEVRVEIEDDGPGIEPRHMDRIFERFYRVDPGRSRDMGGTGLGLSIVKHLVEAMGGKVGFEPAAPKGSRFWFVLPRLASG